jgi:hypothetical protein
MKKADKLAALKEYENTRNLLLLQRRLGHKSIRSTFAFIGQYQCLLKNAKALSGTVETQKSNEGNKE